MTKLPEPVLEQARALRANRDNLAARLGAARLDYRRLEDAISASLARSSQAEQQLLEQELRAMGLEPSERDYRLDYETGTIRALVDGEWKEV